MRQADSGGNEHHAALGRERPVDQLVAERAAQLVIAEVGLDMSQSPTPAHPVSWVKLAPRTMTCAKTPAARCAR